MKVLAWGKYLDFKADAYFMSFYLLCNNMAVWKNRYNEVFIPRLYSNMHFATDVVSILSCGRVTVAPKEIMHICDRVLSIVQCVHF